MAGDWIPMQKDLWACPEVVRILSAFCPQNVRTGSDKCPQGVRIVSDRLRTKCEIIGALFRTWSLFDTFSDDGILCGYDAQSLDEEVGIANWAENLCHVGWLKINVDSLEMPGFSKHLDQSAKRRMKDAQRKAESRKTASAKCPQNVRSDADKMRTTEQNRTEQSPPTYHPSSEVSFEAVEKVGRLVGGGEEARLEAVDICNRIRKASPRLNRELVWQSAWVSLALDRETILDFLERLRTRSIQKPDSYLKKAMRTLCGANGATWEGVRQMVPPAPPQSQPRASPRVAESVGGNVFNRVPV